MRHLYEPQHFLLTYYNIFSLYFCLNIAPLSQLIRTLVNELQPPGAYMKTWDGKDESGTNVASGVYLYRLKTRKFSATKKMIKLQ